MQKSLFLKFGMIAAVLVLIGISLIMINAVIEERSEFHAMAVRSIAEDSVGPQALAGPVLVIPFTEEFQEKREVDTPGGRQVSMEKRSVQRRHIVFPNELKVKGAVDTDRRYRGIHEVLVYSGQYAVSGDIDVPSAAQLKAKYPNSVLTFGQPFVAVHVGDVRGLRNSPVLTLDGRKAEFQQGANLRTYSSGVHAPLPDFDLVTARRARFAFSVNLDGIERQEFVPIAKNTEVTVSSPWPHPQFTGRFLPSPRDRTISADGFAATWRVSSLASNAQQQFLNAESANPNDVAAARGAVDRFAVGFVEPVNVYSLADRATKYGLMFVALTFAAFFVFEMLRQLQIHPVQYALVGLALALFFLLLVSLSEKIPFASAYLIASTGCIALITFYLRFVMGHWLRALGFGAALSVLYGALYGLLVSEDMALMLGSLLLFAVLAAVMVTTRNINWYRVGAPAAAP
ncbi:cell envelope integrity protein CreD [Pseudoduganella sp. GCM10020061]|uniref:cell envelope integrity protein CreD n=1 Tax=Pseudoduganella sp. GCM10020061 TaxID=3317345 RepID=UPI003639309C